MKEEIGDKFQKDTKYTRRSLNGGGLDWNNKPELYKTYPNSKKIKLFFPKNSLRMPLNEILKKRKSVRIFSNKPVTKEQLSYLLWASTGIRREENGFKYRTAPSAGALYPIETYLVINRVNDIPSGIYHYSIKNHLLEQLKTGDFGSDLTHAALEQDMCKYASFVIIWTAIFNRSKWKYGERAYRYVYLDAGHIAENLALASTSLDLGSCQIAALFDDEVNKLIEVDGKEESVIYMSVVGNLEINSK
jgi:SagB-type dehydrogenase family enzyme